MPSSGARAGGGGAGNDLGRKRSLIRPERNRIDQDHPNYHYRQHAQNMTVLPSTTGNDPLVEDIVEADTASSNSTDMPSLNRHEPTITSADSDSSSPRPGHGPGGQMSDDDGRHHHHHHLPPPPPPPPPHAGAHPPKVNRKLTRHNDPTAAAPIEKGSKPRRRRTSIERPSLWVVYCRLVTCCCPNSVLSCFGKPAKAQQRAWREKVGLITIILMIAAIVGFLTFGFTQTVCGTPGLRLKVNHVDGGYMIFHGRAYELSDSHHPPARGIPANANVLYDLPEKNAGRDGSFLFQNVNGRCKDVITRAPGSDVPTDADGGLAWYFPCTPFDQDGSTPPNTTVPYYLGYGCHTTATGRGRFYGLRSAGEVYFTWDDVRNRSRNLMVYSGDVLDLDLLRWFNRSQVSVPAAFDDIRTNPRLRGVDVTRAYQSPPDKRLVRCLSEIIRVGSIDTETVGCIASKVVLYVSLAFILAIVFAKFLLALFFRWFFARRFAAFKSAWGWTGRRRQRQIEDWSNDIYRAPPRYYGGGYYDAVVLPGPGGAMVDRNRRGSTFFPTTSRFTSPYDVDRSSHRPQPTTMASQSSGSRLLLATTPAAAAATNNTIITTPMYRPSNGSLGTLPVAALDGSNRTSMMMMPPPPPESRSSLMLAASIQDPLSTSLMTENDMVSGGAGAGGGAGPAGFVHEAVVPQPPTDWQPFGYPLAHTICLVTAYSEGATGIRTTLDSIATTEYPNSHKLIFMVCDGLIKGHGEEFTTPDIVLGMMRDHTILPDETVAHSYVAVSSGAKRHNKAKVYAGFYDYGEDSVVPVEKRQRVPMMIVVKCGDEVERERRSKPGNRGKRDSQIILMAFLQKVMFDERMTELEFEMFNGIWKITGISPDFYEIVLMVDADTKVFPDSLTHMVSAMVQDPDIMGLCGETKIANKTESWVTMMQVFEYFISHHLSKSFESIFGGVTCLPGCFCMYRVKAPKGGRNYWVPILANPDVVEHYSENVVDTLHKKNLLLLGEDRYLSTLMLKTFPKRKQVFVPYAVCKTTVPAQFTVLLSQRRRWINSTVHNLMELVLVRDLCGTFCFSMQFVVFIELVGTLVLPAAISFTFYLGQFSSLIYKQPPPPTHTHTKIFLSLSLSLTNISKTPADRLEPSRHLHRPETGSGHPTHPVGADPRPSGDSDRGYRPSGLVRAMDDHLPFLSTHLEFRPTGICLLEV